MAKDKEEDVVEEKKGGKKKLIIIGVVVGIVLGAAGFFFLKPGGDAAAKPAPKEGAVLVADAIHINLAEGHFLKIGIALQGIEKPKAKEMDASKALNATIIMFSGRDIKELEDGKKREELRAELKETVAKLYEEDVMDVYFTEFVVQ